MKGFIATGLFAIVLGACASEEGGLEWVAPMEVDVVPMGDAIELAVATPSAATVQFTIDGADLATCDPSQPDEDCKRDDVYRWTTVFTAIGTHEITAIAFDDDGAELERVTRTLRVVRSLPNDGDEVFDELDESLTLGEETAAEPDDIPTLAAAGRGLLDPDRGFHDIFGGVDWRVVNQRVKLRTGTPMGTTSDVNRCMNRFGASIRKWADFYRLSRASVVATALTESSCTNPSGSSDGLSSGPMQVTASTCSAITGLSRSTCRVRMHTQPDFSFHVGAKYMGSSFQKNQHHRDPPKIAAAYNAGSLRKTFSNRWHMVSTGNHIDRFVRWYNAYRVWETQQ